MTNETILKKAIEKAVKNGWLKDDKVKIETYALRLPTIMLNHNMKGEKFLTAYEIIFSHDFAKAFWGEEWKEGDCIKQPADEMFLKPPLRWQYHLQQMVLEENPIKYLEKFL